MATVAGAPSIVIHVLDLLLDLASFWRRLTLAHLTQTRHPLRMTRCSCARTLGEARRRESDRRLAEEAGSTRHHTTWRRAPAGSARRPHTVRCPALALLPRPPAQPAPLARAAPRRKRRHAPLPHFRFRRYSRQLPRRPAQAVEAEVGVGDLLAVQLAGDGHFAGQAPALWPGARGSCCTGHQFPGGSDGRWFLGHGGRLGQLGDVGRLGHSRSGGRRGGGVCTSEDTEHTLQVLVQRLPSLAGTHLRLVVLHEQTEQRE